ncbi:MAG: hypothetical protein U1C72_01290, partial [Candidatus Pacearchaeota archaeon]|nr:hypothetical protein [Candidatus Pacearchaeota archaeon]
MRTNSKRALFFLLSLLFLTGAPFLILYSQGYRIDWSRRSLSQTGGIYIKAVPGRTLVRVADRDPKQTDFLFGTILVDNLLADTSYEVTVSKEGYHSWNKPLGVQPRGVTEAKNVILIPTDLALTEVAGGVGQASFSPNGKYAILSGTDLLNLDTHERTPLSSSLAKVIWSREGTRLLLGNSVFTLEDSSCQAGCEVTGSLGQAAFSLDSLIALSGTTLRQINYETDSSLTLTKDAVAFAVSETGSVLWIDAKGDVWSSTPTRKISETTGPFSSLKLLLFGQDVFLLDREGFSLLKNEGASLILSGIGRTLLSPDGKKLVLERGSELWLYYLKDEEGQPARRAGETVFLTRFSEAVSDLSWVSAHYLVFSTGDHVTIMETDTRDRLNSVEIANFTSPEVFWSQSQKKLYLLSGSVLSSSIQLL